jgi:hypothetical protein
VTREVVLEYPSIGALEADHEGFRAVLVHPVSGARLGFDAEVKWVKPDAPGAGVGLQFLDFGPQERDALRRFVEDEGEAATDSTVPAQEPV